ncbi:MAG: glycosyltransferase [Candidatus Magasanikbacteria bacterium]|nr:glycosyltransferase [Candidatus Magasanikbacteria bacterium]
MTVCLIHNLYPPYSVGGAETFVLEQTKTFLEKGDRVVIITLRPFRDGGFTIQKTAEPHGVLVYRYWSPNVCFYGHLAEHGFVYKLFWHGIDIWNWWSARIIRKILIKENVTHVYTHNLMGVSFRVPRMLSRLSVHHTHIVHDVQLIDPSGILPWNHTKETPVQQVYMKVMNRAFSRVKNVVFLSHFIENFYTQRGFFTHAKKTVLPLPHISSQKIQRPTKRILFVGSLVEQKGIAILQSVWSRISDRSSLELHIVGDGHLRASVETWAKQCQNVFVHGRLNRTEVAHMYEESDVVLFLSLCIENRPQVIEEALQHGLSIIASNTGGVSELVEGQKQVTLVEPGNVNQIIQSIEKLLL